MGARWHEILLELRAVLCSARSPSKGKDGWIQLIDYNLGRFEIKDPKGEYYGSRRSSADASVKASSSRYMRR